MATSNRIHKTFLQEAYDTYREIFMNTIAPKVGGKIYFIYPFVFPETK